MQPWYASKVGIVTMGMPVARLMPFRVLMAILNPVKEPGEGVGILEAPRGTLVHHYVADKNGITTDVNLVVGTTNNNAPMNLSVRKAATALIKNWMVSDGLLNAVEMAYRAYDPCNSCATHTLPGQMPIDAVVRRSDGSVYKTLSRSF